MATIEMLCLANSKKHGGRCVAGVRTDGGGWFRPVAESEDGALFPHHYSLPDGSEPRILDVIQIGTREHSPRPHQPENWCVGRERWNLVARPGGDDCLPLLCSHFEPGPLLFGSTSDRVPYDLLLGSPAPASLALVAPRELKWRLVANPTTGKTQVRARFRLHAALYELVVTDPSCLARLQGLAPGLYPPTSAGFEPADHLLLTISLGEPFEGNCFKLVAGVVAVPAAWYTAVVGSVQGHDRPRVTITSPAVIRNPLLAEYAVARGSLLARRLAGRFDSAWTPTGPEDQVIQHLRQVMEAQFRERLNEATGG